MQAIQNLLLLTTSILLFNCTLSVAQKNSTSDCADAALNLLESSGIDIAFQKISSCKKLYNQNQKINATYRRLIWALKEDYYHSSSDLDLMNEFKLEINNELIKFPKDTILTNLLAQVTFDMSFRLVHDGLTEKGIQEINSFLNIYPNQTQFLEPIILNSVFDLMRQDSVDISSLVIDLLLQSQINKVSPEEKFTELVKSKLEIGEFQSASDLYILSTTKALVISEKLVELICDRLYDAYQKEPSISLIKELQLMQKSNPRCTELYNLEKKYLLSFIDNSIREKDYSSAGQAFQLAKKSFRNDTEILKQKRQWIIDDYRNNYLNSFVAFEQLNWTGDIETCNPGTISTFSNKMVLKRVNYFRRIAGVSDSCKLNPDYSDKAQKAAIIMLANNELNHHPPTSWKCYSKDGDIGAGESNLSLGSHSSEAVTRQMEDNGTTNYGVGHRRWILYPGTTIIGHGSTDRTQALMVNGKHVDTGDFYKEFFISWPPEHYAPKDLVFNRWSFSIEGADFENAKIKMMSDGKPISIAVEKLDNEGAGDNSIVWIPNLDNSDKSKPYFITISDVFLESDRLKENPMTYDYWVQIVW